MTHKSYVNFDLLMQDFGDSYQVQVIDSPAGQATHTFTLPFSTQQLENLILKFDHAGDADRSLDITETGTYSGKDMGRVLFQSVFNGSIAKCFHASLTVAKHTNEGLRIRLRLSSAEKLINIPWELLFDEESNSYLGLSLNTPIIRKLDLPYSSRLNPVKGPLHVLVMISNPRNHPQLNVEREWEQINQATQKLQQEGFLKLTMIEPSLEVLQRNIRQDDYHVFHYIGHGGFDRSSSDGMLVLENNQKDGQLVSGELLGAILHDETTLQLVILNACNGGRTSLADPFAGVGQNLLRKGIPAVIAMQFAISDSAAINFSTGFYTALVDGYPIDAAVTEARKFIYAKANPIEWATPVLYTSRDSNNPLCEPASETQPDSDNEDLKQAPSSTHKTDPPPEKPIWAKELGDDQYGYYTDLIVNGITQRFRWVKPGKFWMGAPKSETGRGGKFLWLFSFGGKETLRSVTLTKGFWMADTACTQALWETVIGENPACFKHDRNNPVENINWKQDIQAFLQKLQVLVPALVPTLPTEAQWEYACRADTNTPFSYGRNINHEQVNYDGGHPYANGKKGVCRGKTVPVKSLPPNPWGLYGMHGNIWELCLDTYQKKLPAIPAKNPKVTSQGNKMVIKGGSCFSSGWAVRSATRYGNTPENRDNSIGFRLVINT